jgi:bacillolysin
MPKKVFVFLAGMVFIVFGVGASHVGGPVVQQGFKAGEPASGKRVEVDGARQLAAWDSFIELEMAGGRLVCQPVVLEPDGTAHQRLNQYYQGLPVWGGQLIRHYRRGSLSLVNGRYYPGIQAGTLPGLSPERAVDIARAGGPADSELSLRFPPALVIWPVETGYALAYKILLSKRGKEILSFVDAVSGQVLLQYDDVKTEAAIGTGTGVHGDTKKISTDSYGSGYRTWDKMRPAAIKTFDFLADFNAWWYYDYTDANLGFDSDNSWTGSSQAPILDGHDYAGWTYDYFYIVHDRKSFNNANMIIKVHTNFDIWGGVNNAFYDGYDDSLNFYDGDQVTYTYFAGALDIVAHEYSHAVTNYTCALNYYQYPGALNESFSDIMGACVEFYHEPEGAGFQKADWLAGEDALKVYNVNNVFRRLDKPYLLKAWGTFPYPDHWTLRYTGSSDNAGVHVNSSISNHWFYLLTVGGTNRVSGITVPGIGRDKSEKIAYKAWTSYLFPSADFWDARTACIQAARDLYGTGSTEEGAVKTAWQAVGIY